MGATFVCEFRGTRGGIGGGALIPSLLSCFHHMGLRGRFSRAASLQIFHSHPIFSPSQMTDKEKEKLAKRREKLEEDLRNLQQRIFDLEGAYLGTRTPHILLVACRDRFCFSTRTCNVLLELTHCSQRTRSTAM